MGTQDKTALFLSDLMKLLADKHNQAFDRSQQGDPQSDAAFHSGAAFAYYDVMDLIQAQLKAFGYPIDPGLIPTPGKRYDGSPG